MLAQCLPNKIIYLKNQKNHCHFYGKNRHSKNRHRISNILIALFIPYPLTSGLEKLEKVFWDRHLKRPWQHT